MSVFKKVISVISALALLFAIALFLISPVRYALCVREGISLWAVSVLPSVFPFLFLTAALSQTKPFAVFSRRIAPVSQKLFRISGTGAGIFLLSVLSGYPVGARTIADYEKNNLLPKEELFRLSCLCSTCGPVFLIGVVGGGMLNNALLGALMLLCHLTAVTLISFLLSRRAQKPTARPIPFARAKSGLFENIYSAVIAVLCVGGSIALFACFSQMLADIFRLNDASMLTALIRGLVEMTTGCNLLCKNPTPFSLSLCCFLTTFGGGCVLFQQLAFLTPTGIKPFPFILVKLTEGVLAAGLFYPLALLLL